MAHGVPEPDWKVFSELRKVALERFCARVLEEIEAASSDASRSYHERYLTVYRLLQKRDEQLAIAFNDPRRSGMMIQLVAVFNPRRGPGSRRRRVPGSNRSWRKQEEVASP